MPAPTRVLGRAATTTAHTTVMLAVAALVVTAALLGAACGTDGGPGNAADGATAADLPGEPNAEVIRVVDGDTLVVRTGGVEEHVRLIGIDTPESVKPGTPVECFGKEASAHATELLSEGSSIVLERDVEARDRYDRLLAYVYRASDALFVNLSMVQDGYAQAATYPPNVAHTDEFVEAGRTARENDLGLWGECGGDDLYG